MKRQALIDGSGRVMSRGLHDATVCAFHFVAEERFEICLRDEDGMDKWFYFVDVPLLGFKDVLNGQIISDLFCWRLDEPTSVEGETGFAWSVLLGEDYRAEELPARASRLAKEYAGHSLIFFLTSYGGSIAAICREILVDDDQASDP